MYTRPRVSRQVVPDAGFSPKRSSVYLWTVHSLGFRDYYVLSYNIGYVAASCRALLDTTSYHDILVITEYRESNQTSIQ